MFNESRSGNQLRSKGIMIKRVLQICLLLLLVNLPSHALSAESLDKEEASAKVESDDVIVVLKLGRKDVPRVQEVSVNYFKQEEEENGVEEQIKHDEEVEESSRSRLQEEEQEEDHQDEENEEPDDEPENGDDDYCDDHGGRMRRRKPSII